MSKVLCESQDLVNIADAIRFKTGTTGEMYLDDMPARIKGISGIETVDVTFPRGIIPTVYYTNAYGEFVSEDFGDYPTENLITITCVKNSVIAADVAACFDGSTYIIPDTTYATALKIGGGVCSRASHKFYI